MCQALISGVAPQKVGAAINIQLMNIVPNHESLVNTQWVVGGLVSVVVILSVCLASMGVRVGQGAKSSNRAKSSSWGTKSGGIGVQAESASICWIPPQKNGYFTPYRWGRCALSAIVFPRLGAKSRWEFFQIARIFNPQNSLFSGFQIPGRAAHLIDGLVERLVERQ